MRYSGRMGCHRRTERRVAPVLPCLAGSFCPYMYVVGQQLGDPQAAGGVRIQRPIHCDRKVRRFFLVLKPCRFSIEDSIRSDAWALRALHQFEILGPREIAILTLPKERQADLGILAEERVLPEGGRGVMAFRRLAGPKLQVTPHSHNLKT